MKFIKRILLIIATGTLSLQFSCAPAPVPSLKIGEAYAIGGTYYHPAIQPAYKEIGYASWYGSRFHKKTTANGEIFDKGEFTAAHKTLPLPSVVKVTNLDNGRTIMVRVNDRGPFVRGRIIDMSENAASALGFKGRGTARVLVELDRQASLALLKDPRLRMKEATKKLVQEAYSKYDMPSSRSSRENQSELTRQELLAQAPQPIQLQEPKLPASQAVRLPPRKPVITRMEIQQVTQNLRPQNLNLQKLPTTRPEPALKVMKPPSPAESFSVQVASTTSMKDAEKISARFQNLSSKIGEASVNGRRYFRVQLTGIDSVANAKNILNQAKSIGFKDAYIVKDHK